MNYLIKLIEENNLGTYKENVSFSSLTTYKTGGIAKLLYFPNSIESLKKVLKTIKEKNIKFKIFGNGSNILASDKEYDGVIIKLTNLNNLKIDNENIEVEAGYLFNVLCTKASKLGLKGLEFGCGIPGTVGGAIYMNAGAYLDDTAHHLTKVEYLDEDLNIKEISKEKLNFSYRNSLFMKKNWIILKGYFTLEKGDKEYIQKLLDERKTRRNESQPLNYPSAGSVFRNPENNYAGKLIEDSNLKGYTHNGAKISDKHANFIINYKDASSADIKYLMDLAKQKVKENYKIEMHIEQELFNFGDNNE